MANDNLVIANFNKQGDITGSVSSSAGGAQIPIKAGPQSFIQVSNAAVNGSLPWTVSMHASGTVANLTVSKLPAIAAFGEFHPSGAFNFGYLTSVIYP
jgi:hypothetical protein